MDVYALITGASSGIGKAIAAELAKKKINLILVSRRKPELETLKAQLESQFGISISVFSVDLSREDECRKLHQDCQVFAPEIIVNNAGFGCIGMFADNNLDDELRMIRLNVEGLHILTKLFSRSMKSGIILNVASMAAFLPTPFMASYAATKAYVHHLSRAVDYELRVSKKPVRVLTLCPGPVDTNFSYAAGGQPGIKGISAEQCAKIAVRGILRKHTVILPGFGLRLMRFFLRFLPLGLVLPVAYRIQKKKN
jgi:hypothetical protein